MLATRPYLEGSLLMAQRGPLTAKRLAFTTSESKKSIRSVLWAVSVADGSVREIYSTPNQIGRPRWLPDGSGLLASIGNIISPFAGNSGSFLFQRDKQGVLRMI